MSSWSSGRIHFRERKTPVPSLIPNPIQIPVSTPSILNEFPSKYVSNRLTAKNDAIVCCIALNEEPYIDEWIKYHLALGFSHIYIYDNSDTNTLKNRNSNNVTIIHFPGKTKQLEAYDMCVLQYKNKHKWCAFIDCDEFIVLKKHNSIMEFLNEYNDCDSIALNWLMFGSSNKKEYHNEPVTSRFRYCSSTVNDHIKCICKLNSINKYASAHHPQLYKGDVFDTNKKIIYGPLNSDGDLSVACIHHYYTKSEEEFREKIERGRADIIQKRSLDELINIHSNNNNVYNSDAWDFYSKHL